MFVIKNIGTKEAIISLRNDKLGSIKDGSIEGQSERKCTAVSNCMVTKECPTNKFRPEVPSETYECNSH